MMLINGYTLKLHAKVIPFMVIRLASSLRALHVSLKYRTAYLSDTLRCCHLLCPEPPPGTTTVHYWYRVLCLVYLMRVCVCFDVIISVSILH